MALHSQDHYLQYAWSQPLEVLPAHKSNTIHIQAASSNLTSCYITYLTTKEQSFQSLKFHHCK
jgi:hypothetical protein